jgi:pyrroloquinoline-quinone synthase
MEKSEFKNAILSKQDKYHIHHPFHIKMNSGGCTRKEVQIWVANRYYYQETIPRKDAAILMNCDNPTIRREWIKRIQDHDEGGGIDAWVSLGESVGLTRDILESHSMLLPGVKFAVDAYYHFCKDSNYHDAMTSSLTELFAPEIHQVRLDNWPKYYPWIELTGYQYFKKRLSEARRDVNFTLEYAANYYTTPPEQSHAFSIVDFKLNVLWCMLDSISIECDKLN